MSGIVIEVRSRKLQRALQVAAQHSLNMKPAFSIIGGDLERSIQRNFDDEGRPRKWEAWSPAYGQWRMEHKPGKVLSRDSVLRNSITSRPDRHGVTVGTNVVYAAIHQKGGKIRRGRGRATVIPARPYLMVQPEDEAEAVRTIEQWIVGSLR